MTQPMFIPEYLRPTGVGRRPRNSPAELFWEKVKTDGPVVRPELGPCHVWAGCLNDDGYGEMSFMGKRERSHRVAFFLANGRWPKPQALHRCDNRACVRGEHLFEGTNKDNVDDKVAKGRALAFAVRGEDHPCAKLSNADLDAIRSAAAAGTKNCDLAAQFGVTRTRISQIVRGRTGRAITLTMARIGP